MEYADDNNKTTTSIVLLTNAEFNIQVFIQKNLICTLKQNELKLLIEAFGQQKYGEGYDNAEMTAGEREA